jgi:uncharacterized membrane protein YkvA (DUF1232 family)
MNIQRIRQMIGDAVADEERTGGLAGIFRQLANARGVRPKSSDLKQAVRFCREYVEHAPMLLEATASAARKAGISGDVIPVLQVAEEYFYAPDDVIPDHLGLVGLTDDAYLALSLVQAVSDNYRNRAGAPLIGTDLTEANKIMRVIIGEPAATQLDLAVASVLAGPIVQQALTQLGRFGGTLPVADPIWGNASAREIADVQLGAMGIV